MKSEQDRNFGFSQTSKRLGIALLSCAAGLAALAQPANDNFANRILINGNQTTLSGSLSNATAEAGEPFFEVSSGQTAWWTWTAPSDGIVTLSGLGTGFNPLLAVYTGNDLPNLTLVATNLYVASYENTMCGSHWRTRRQIEFHVAQGQAYQIGVDSALYVDSGWTYELPSAPERDVELISALDVDSAWRSEPPPTNTIILRGWYYDYGQFAQITNVLAGGDVQLGLKFTPAPANDDFTHATKLSGARKHLTASNEGATRESGEPIHSGNPGGSSVWYSWTAPATGRVTLSANEIAPYAPPTTWNPGGYGVVVINLNNFNPVPTCGAEVDQNPPPVFYPVFAAYTGASVDSLISANCLPLDLPDFPHAVCFDATKGQTYQIAFDGNMGTTGKTPLYLALTKPASNDNFKNRIKLHGIYVVATSFNAGATHEPGEPAPIEGSSGKSVWWSWTAPVTGTVSISLEGSDYVLSPVSVFTGSTIGNLQLVASGFGGGAFGTTSFEAVAGQTYQISVSDYQGHTGAIKMKVEAPVIEAELQETLSRSSKVAVLRFAALPGQKLLLQRQTEAAGWENLGAAVARRNTVEFLVRPAPTDAGPYYRAIIVDYVPVR